TSAPSAPLISTPAAGEPVAPVTAGLASDADSQVGGRRRRRRGSRRRSDRLGDGVPYAEGEGGPAEGTAEITPTTSDVDVVLASSGTVEEAPPAPVEVEAVEAPAAPRNRRRTARRPTATTEPAAEPSAEAAPPAP